MWDIYKDELLTRQQLMHNLHYLHLYLFSLFYSGPSDHPLLAIYISNIMSKPIHPHITIIYYTLIMHKFQSFYKICKELDEKATIEENSIVQKEGKKNSQEDYTEKSISNYQNSVFDNSIKYYLDEDGNLNVIVDIEIPAGRGTFETPFEI